MSPRWCGGREQHLGPNRANGHGASTPATGIDFGGEHGLTLTAPAGLASPRHLPGAF